MYLFVLRNTESSGMTAMRQHHQRAWIVELCSYVIIRYHQALTNWQGHGLQLKGEIKLFILQWITVTQWIYKTIRCIKILICDTQLYDLIIYDFPTYMQSLDARTQINVDGKH